MGESPVKITQCVGLSRHVMGAGWLSVAAWGDARWPLRRYVKITVCSWVPL